MSVDFPAPLSPRRQVTCPAGTDMVTSRSATTLPKRLETPLHLGRIGAVIGPPRRGGATKLLKITAATSIDAEEHLEPVGVHAGDHDALLHHAENERSQHGADRGAVAAGEERPADHGGDDGAELLLLARGARRRR